MPPLFTGQNIIRLTSVGSTNNYTTEKMRQSVMPEGTVVVTQEQTEGKGQRGNSWVAEPGKNLTFSLVYYPAFLQADKQFALTQAVSLALADFLNHYQLPEVRIKWPNDIYADSRKIAGILIETAVAGHQLKHAVIGIGLNVNQLHFPKGIKATSMQLLAKKKFRLEGLLEELCGYLESRYLKLKNRQQQIEEDYHQQLYLLGKEADFALGDGRFKGVVSGVDKQGRLLVNDGNTERVFNFKEIEFLS